MRSNKWFLLTVGALVLAGMLWPHLIAPDAAAATFLFAGAVVNTKSAAVTAMDVGALSGYRSPADVALADGKLRRLVGLVEQAASDSNNSTYRPIRLRSSDVVTSVQVACDAITGGTSYDIGIYQTAENGGAVVSVSLFASAITLASALDWTEQMHEATATDKDKIEKQLWQRLGLTADPKRDYDLVLTGNTVGSTGGTIIVRADVIRAEG